MKYTYYIVESGVKHHKPPPTIYGSCDNEGDLGNLKLLVNLANT
jgi:hypothetical protein